nr:hypothetical protein [Clostridia bacterium]
MVAASYNIRNTPRFVNKDATLRVYSNGTSEMTLHFANAYGTSFDMPEDAFIRLIKVDGVEGNFGQAPLVLTGENNSSKSQFSATVHFNRAFGKSQHLTFAICRSDGKEKQQIKYVLDKFDSADGKWPEPESTPEVPTIPPVKPTPTPTPRPTLVPGTTEPPHDTARLTVKFNLRESTKNFTDLGATLRIYEDMSALTAQFKYSKEIAEGTTMRMSRADNQMGFFGEAPITTLADGAKQVTLLFNQQVGPINNFNMEAFAPGAQIRSFKAFYKLNGRAPAGWSEMDPIATTRPAETPTPTPLPEDLTPTPAPTVPPQSKFISQARFALLDPVKHFSLKSAVHRRYQDGLSVLKIEFRYSGELPANAVLRVTQAEYLEGNFGEAIIEKGEGDLLTATIITDQLQGSLQAYRLRCYDAKGNEQFYADFAVTIANALWAGGYEASIARSMLPTATPAPEDETPAPTVTVAATEGPSAVSTLAPTEPPYADARSKRKFQMLDKVKNYANYNVTLRRYNDFDVLTVYFRYTGDIPEGAVMRLTQVDSVIDNYGEAPILPSELTNARKDLLCAKIASNKIPLNCTALRLRVFAPDGSELFTADYFPDERGYDPDDVRSLLNGQATTSSGDDAMPLYYLPEGSTATPFIPVVVTPKPQQTNSDNSGGTYSIQDNTQIKIPSADGFNW